MLKISTYLLAACIVALLILQILNIVPFFVVPETTLEVPSVVLVVIAFVVGAGLASVPYVHARIRAFVAPQKSARADLDSKGAMPLLANAPRLTESPMAPDEPTPSERKRHVANQPDVTSVPVESLSNGVINALGDGLSTVSAPTSGSITRAVAEGSQGVLRGAKLQLRDWFGPASRKSSRKKRST